MEPMLRFVGIDVAKAHLDIASRPDGQEFRLPNSPEGIAALVGRLKSSPPTLILFEATGGLEWAAVVALAEAGMPIRIVEPGRVRHFARSIGQHSKTDAIDARVLAHYAEAVRPEARDLPDEKTRDLQTLLDRRRQLVTMRVSEDNRRKQGPTAAVRADLESHNAYLNEQIDSDRQIDRQDDRGRCRVEAPRRGAAEHARGRGPDLADAPGPAARDRLTDGQAGGALAGLAPRARDSGTVRAARTIFGGRADVRTALSMAALSAMRHNPELRAFYQRLRKAGKAAKVAITAVSRKLLTIVNAMIRDMKPWELKMTATAT